MDIAFRVDASHQIGTGHVMRCLTLADALHQRDANIWFISRYMPDHLQKMIESRGYSFKLLPTEEARDRDELAHSHWLGVRQEDDAQATCKLLQGHLWHWMVVDHYALDKRWETKIRDFCHKILVIDDLADRAHDCDILIDQNCHPTPQERYSGKVLDHSLLLLGPRFALLRPEFCVWREKSKIRSGEVNRINVFFGGVDSGNVTFTAIKALKSVASIDIAVDVVIGAKHPFRTLIEAECLEANFACHVQTNDIAALMAQADLAIGAGGAATWERCCLGLPTLTIALAANQVAIAEGLQSIGACIYLGRSEDVSLEQLECEIRRVIASTRIRAALSKKSYEILDARGAFRVSDLMAGRNENNRSLH